MENYIVLDIESPNTNFNSISAIGIVIVENNQVIDKKYSLINPEDEFEDYIIDLTGITPDMVADKPTFKEFWPYIEELLITNVIVGHNITYDLTVIVNSLKNYDIDVPDFKYVCTLELSRKLLALPSYSLTNIMHGLEVDYDAHNALADAEVTHYLFNYLDNIKRITAVNQRLFDKNKSNESIDEDLYPNINELYGIMLEFRYKNKITDNQIEIFQSWIDRNEEYSSYKKIYNIISRLKAFISKKNIDKTDKINISMIVHSITKSDKYSSEELNYQVLVGILEMLKCDDEVNEGEHNFLKKWLTYYTLPKDVNIDELY